MSKITLSDCSGVTFFEVITTLVIIGTVSAICVPSATELYAGYQRAGLQELLAVDLQRASNRAAFLGTRVVFRIANDGTSYSMGPDYTPYATPPNPEIVEVERELPNAFTLGPAGTLLFDSRGFLVDTAGNLLSANLTMSESGITFATASVSPAAIAEFSR